MVKLTDAHAEALALVGTGTLTHEQVDSVLDVFSNSGLLTSYARYYRAESLEKVGLTYHTFVDNKCITLSTTHGNCDVTVDAIIRGFLWGGVAECFDIKLEDGHDDYDYALQFRSKDTNIWGALFFRLSRTPYEVID
jgi:hypothetical protein